jgi:hypothetical protein
MCQEFGLTKLSAVQFLSNRAATPDPLLEGQIENVKINDRGHFNWKGGKISSAHALAETKNAAAFAVFADGLSLDLIPRQWANYLPRPTVARIRRSDRDLGEKKATAPFNYQLFPNPESRPG